MEKQTTHAPEAHVDIEALAKRYDLSRSAVEAARDALARNGGSSAQFSHPDLGGSVQWMGGGMLQIGDMFNSELKGRVAGLLKDLSASLKDAPSEQKSEASAAAKSPEPEPAKSEKREERSWWPEGLGKPSTVGGQNDWRYAYFPDAHRLVVEQNGKRTLYDTKGHSINGVAQSQGDTQSLVFSSDEGTVRTSDLRVVGG